MDVVIAVGEGIGAKLAHLDKKEKEQDHVQQDDAQEDGLIERRVIAEDGLIAGLTHYHTINISLSITSQHSPPL